MPSKGQTQNVQILLAKYGQQLVPFKCEGTDTGEYIPFASEQLVKV